MKSIIDSELNEHSNYTSQNWLYVFKIIIFPYFLFFYIFLLEKLYNIHIIILSLCKLTRYTMFNSHMLLASLCNVTRVPVCWIRLNGLSFNWRFMFNNFSIRSLIYDLLIYLIQFNCLIESNINKSDVYKRQPTNHNMEQKENTSKKRQNMNGHTQGAVSYTHLLDCLYLFRRCCYPCFSEIIHRRLNLLFCFKY